MYIGIYDMSGGNWEFMASGLTDYIDNGNSYTAALKTVSGFSEKLVDRYAGTSETNTTNYEEEKNRLRYGDAVYEISLTGTENNSWNGNYSYFLETGIQFTVRGGAVKHNSYVGIMGFGRAYGTTGSDTRFPTSLCACSI